LRRVKERARRYFIELSCGRADSRRGMAVWGRRAAGCMRILVLIVALLMFCAALLLDTAGVLQLSWICIRGGCGISARWVWLGLGISLACILAAPLVRRLRAMPAAAPAQAAARRRTASAKKTAGPRKVPARASAKRAESGERKAEAKAVPKTGTRRRPVDPGAEVKPARRSAKPRAPRAPGRA
jgi:hypothetical protein